VKPVGIVLWIAIAFACCIGLPVHAQRQPLTADQIRQYIRMYDAEVERREARIKALTQQIFSLDEDIEYRVKSVLDTLKGARDSVDSKSRVMGMKLEAIQALEKSITYYARERDKRLRALVSSHSTLPEADTKRDLDVLDERIDKRIAQVSDLARSFEQHK
jgi:hypothetical protein